MSHCKFEHPRHGNLGFRSRKRARSLRPRAKGTRKDDQKKPPHFTCFLGYKAGMTQVMRGVDRPELKKLHNKEVVEAVTYLETPPCVVVGVRGYVNTPNGLKSMHTVFAQHLSEEFKRRLYKNWYNARKKAFVHYAKKYENEESKQEIKSTLDAMKKECSVIRAILHTQPSKINGLDMKKGHIYEVKINGGNIAQKVDFVTKYFEKEVNIDDMYNDNEMCDLVGVTKGHGYQGVVKRFSVKRLQRKTRRGRRKVACIGSWHPTNVRDTVPRGGQMGYHHRTIKNVKIYSIRDGSQTDSGTTSYDKTVKSLNPLGGFRAYGVIKNKCLMVKGSVMGPQKRPILIKNTCTNPKIGDLKEKIELKFIDTSSQIGSGRFQTTMEKRGVMGPLKRDLMVNVS